MDVILPWKDADDGSFVNAFSEHCFTTFEKESYCKRCGKSWFLFDRSRNLGPTFEIRKVIVDMITAWANNNTLGIVLKSKSGDMFQAFEFNGMYKRINQNNDKSEPLVEVSYVISSSFEKAKLFIRDEEMEIITCSEEAALALAHYFNRFLTDSGLIDFSSGLTIKEGMFGPIDPTSDEKIYDKLFETEKSNMNIPRLPEQLSLFVILFIMFFLTITSFYYLDINAEVTDNIISIFKIVAGFVQRKVETATVYSYELLAGYYSE